MTSKNALASTSVSRTLFFSSCLKAKKKTVSLDENMFQVLQSPSEVSRKIFARVRVVIVMVSSYVLTMLRYIVVSIVS